MDTQPLLPIPISDNLKEPSTPEPRRLPSTPSPPPTPPAKSPKTSHLVAVGQSFLLGGIFMTSLVIAVTNRNLYAFGLHIASLAAFHFLEYFLQAKYHPETVDNSAFLLDHSREYFNSLLLSLTELALETLIFPVSIKQSRLLRFLGTISLLIGHFLRVLAMTTAKENFSHLVRTDLTRQHRLITSGIYGYVRHPSYTGFFLWALGNQVLLVNPLSVAAYFIILGKFFKERIEYEEAALLDQYGNEYRQYRKKTWSGIPGVQ